MNKKTTRLLVAVVLVIVLVCLYLLYREAGGPAHKTDKLVGAIVAVEGSTVTISGTFQERVDQSLGVPLQPSNISFRVDERTKFEKIEIKMPTREERLSSSPHGPDGASSGSFKLEDLPRAEGEGSLTHLKEALSRGSVFGEVYIRIDTLNSGEPLASTIKYTVLLSSFIK